MYLFNIPLIDKVIHFLLMLIAYFQFIVEMPQHYCPCMSRIKIDYRQIIERACEEPKNDVPPMQVASLVEDLWYSEMVKLMTYLERDAKESVLCFLMFPSSFLHHVLQSFYKYKTRVTILM